MLVLCLILITFTNTINYKQKYIHSVFVKRITIISLVISIILDFNILYFQSIGNGISLYNDLFQITVITIIIEIILLFIGLSILFGWPSYISYGYGTHLVDKEDYYSLIAIFSILGGSFLISSLDLLSMYLSIELQSFALYILATLNKDNLSSTSAGLKYFLLGSLSSCFILLGAAIIYSFTGLTHFEAIKTLISIFFLDISDYVPHYVISSDLNPIFHEININDSLLVLTKPLFLGFIIILIGFLFKLSAAPFYQWAPDVYDSTPTIVTVWLTIVAKLTIFIFIQGFIDFFYPVSVLNFFTSIELISPDYPESFINSMIKEYTNINFHNPQYIIKNLLLFSSLLSLLIGTIAGLSQVKIKRLLAFSSVSHVGFLLLALGINTQKSIDSFLFYLIQYSFTSLNIFLIILAIGYLYYNHHTLSTYSIPIEIRDRFKSKNIEIDLSYLAELKGLLFNNPILSFSLAICLFSMAGIPPLIGFFSKQFVLFSSIENGNYFLSIVAILVSVISASYYLKIIKIIFFEEEDNYIITSLEKYLVSLDLSYIHSFIISLLTFILLLFFMNPSLILNGTLLISLLIFSF